VLGGSDKQGVKLVQDFITVVDTRLFNQADVKTKKEG